MKNKIRSGIILFASIFFAMLAYGMTMPIFPFILDSLGGSGIHLGLLIATYGIMQLIFAPLWGRISDKKGRKPFIFIGTMGLFLSMLIFGFSRSLFMLYIGQLVSGIFTSALFPVSVAYVSDITEEKDRAGAIGKIGAATGLGVVMGPGIGGLLAFDSLFFPFFIGSGFAFIVALLVLFVLPESLIEKERTNSDKVEKFKIGNILKGLSSPIGFGLLTVFAVYFGKSNFSGIFGLYAMQRFDFGTTEVGGILMVVSVVYALSQGLLVGPLTKKFGEILLIKICLIGNSLGFILIMFASAFVPIILSVCFFIIFNSLLKPSALSYISKRGGENRGASMGIADVYMSLGRVSGPILAGLIFDINILLPFITGATFFVIILVVSLKISKKYNSNSV